MSIYCIYMSRPEYDRNIPFNALPLLPPPEEVEKDPVVLKKLVVSSRALASVNTNILRLPNPYMLVNTIALQEAKASTAIENIFTTEDELYKAASETIRNELIDTATKEVLRYREALWAGYENLENKLIDFNMVLRAVQKIRECCGGGKDE